MDGPPLDDVLTAATPNELLDLVNHYVRRSAQRRQLGRVMCGIAGWVGFGRDLSKEESTVRAMTRTLENRGLTRRASGWPGTWPWVIANSPSSTSSAARSRWSSPNRVPEYRRLRYAEARAEIPVVPGESPEDRRMREITYLNLTRFVQTLLDRKDLLSMATGLEVRVPFCDHRLVEYVFNVPWRMRSAVADLLPTSILDRVKRPIRPPRIPATRPSGELRIRHAEVNRWLAAREECQP